MSKLIVSVPKNEDGTPKHSLIKVSTKNPEWGSVMVVESRFEMKNGVLNTRKRAAYFNAPIATLQALNLREGMDLNSIEGMEKLRIVRKESHLPFFEGQSPKVNPQTSEIIHKNGQPVYFQDGVGLASEQDEIIKETTAQEATAPVAEAGAIS